jgi:hypothetical protein
MRLYDARVAVPRECRQLLSGRMTQQPLERPFWQLGQLSDGMYANLSQMRSRGGSNARDQLDRQTVKEVELSVRVDNHEAVGLRYLRSNLSQVFGARNADRDWQAKLLSHAAADSTCNFGRRPEEMSATSPRFLSGKRAIG